MARSIDRLGDDMRRKINQMAAASQKAAETSVRQAGEQARDAQEDRLRRDSGGDLVLSNVGARKGRSGGRRVGARVKLAGRGAKSVTAEVSAVGPVPIIANPITGHVIRSSYLRGGLRTSRGASQMFGPAVGRVTGGTRRTNLNIPGVGWRASARHPGTRGKNTWNAAKPEALRRVQRTIGRESDRIMRQAFVRGR